MNEESDRQNQQQDRESNLTARGKNNFYSSGKTKFKNYVLIPIQRIDKLLSPLNQKNSLTSVN